MLSSSLVVGFFSLWTPPNFYTASRARGGKGGALSDECASLASSCLAVVSHPSLLQQWVAPVKEPRIGRAGLQARCLHQRVFSGSRVPSLKTFET